MWLFDCKFSLSCPTNQFQPLYCSFLGWTHSLDPCPSTLARIPSEGLDLSAHASFWPCASVTLLPLQPRDGRRGLWWNTFRWDLQALWSSCGPRVESTVCWWLKVWTRKAASESTSWRRALPMRRCRLWFRFQTLSRDRAAQESDIAEWWFSQCFLQYLFGWRRQQF